MGGKLALPLFNFDNSGGVHTVFTIAVSIIGSIAIAAILDRCHLSYILREKGSYANHINDKIKQVEFENGQ